MGKYSSLAADIIKNVGGKEIVESLRHCVTRLRFRLIDESIANDEVIKNMDGVVTVMKAMGEYMVVIGEHVADVYDEVCSQLGLDAMQAENKEQRIARRKFYLKNGFTSSDIFITGASGEMEIMNFGEKVSEEAYIDLQKYALGTVMFRLSKIKVAEKTPHKKREEADQG